MPTELSSWDISGDREGPTLLITGGVHGDEFEPIAAVQRLIDQFASEDQRARLRGALRLVPIVNEAAFLRGHRCGDDGLDLARTCPGDANGSSTEQAAAALSALIRRADFYIDLHTGGTELAVWPLAGYYLVDNREVLDRQRRMAQAFNLPVVWGTSAQVEGRSLSIAREALVPAIYAEYLGSASLQPEGVDAYVDGCLNVMAELDMVDRTIPPSRLQHQIEDHRPESGHMQICNPAPITGFFEPVVELGDVVQRGQELGQVYDPGDTMKHPILAETDGIVLVLRTFPRVLQGESLGVVAPLDPPG